MTAFILTKTSIIGEGRVRLEVQEFGSRADRENEFLAVVSANEMLPANPLGGFFEPAGFVRVARLVADTDGIDEAVAEAAANAAWNYRHPVSGEEAAVEVVRIA